MGFTFHKTPAIVWLLWTLFLWPSLEANNVINNNRWCYWVHWVHPPKCWNNISCIWRVVSLLWRHNGRDGISNRQPRLCLLNRSSRRRSKKTSKLRVTGLCAGDSSVTGEFPAQMDSYAENVSIWWRHQVRVSEDRLYIIQSATISINHWCFGLLHITTKQLDDVPFIWT